MSWAVWITGPPASGKTTLTRAVRELLEKEGVRAAVLESDVLRRILTPRPTYEPEERDRFYAAVADLAALLVAQRIPVLIDATAPRKSHRDSAREKIERLLEVHVEAPLEVREARDPKGLYRLAREGGAPNLPGATQLYEEPVSPDLRVSGEAPPSEGAARILDLLRSRGLA